MSAELTEEQKRVIEGRKWKTSLHLNCENEGVLVQACEELGVSRTVVTPKVKGVWGVGVVTYSVDETGIEYQDLPSLIDAIIERDNDHPQPPKDG